MVRGKVINALLQTTAFRIALIAVVLFILAAGSLVALMSWQTDRVLTSQALATVNAEIIALERAAISGGMSSLRASVDARSSAVGPGLYFLASNRGKKIAGNLSRIPPELARTKKGGVFRYKNAALAATQNRLQTGTVNIDKPRLAFAIPVQVLDHTLFVGRDIEDQRHLAEELRWMSVLGFGALALAGLLGGLAVSYTVLRRIDGISTASQAIMSGDLSQRLPVTGSKDELDTLSKQLNEMLERIEQLMQAMREVSDNIAHDLKTPLNRLRNRAEAALRDPRGGAAHREGLEATIEAADDVMKTFNAMLLIARLESGALDETAMSVDLSDVVQDVVELYEPVAEEASLSLRAEDVHPVLVRANRQLLTQAIANLIDNAIKYSAKQSAVGAAQSDRSVSVSVLHKGHEAEVIVSDRGPGIAHADRDRALKRFVRLEESRTAPGTGLGLSLVAAVARLHKGRICLEDNAPGLRALLYFPTLNHEAPTRLSAKEVSAA